MRPRPIASLTVLVLTLVLTGYGCSNLPTSPSSTASGHSSLAATSDAPSETEAFRLARFGDRSPGVVYVTSQGLYYDTFATRDPLPMKGEFQLLEDGTTEFGPGQPGYLGGRWWVDVNHNGMRDEEDHYFLCPLLPPGRSTP